MSVIVTTHSGANFRITDCVILGAYLSGIVGGKPYMIHEDDYREARSI